MDRMIFTALNALHNMRDTRVVQAQNLANQNVPGFRADLPNEGSTSFLEAMGSETTRAFQLEIGKSGFSDEAGFLSPTGEAMDIAIADQGYFYIQPESGEPALSRRGDLRQGADGVLRDGAGNALLDTALAPIALPPHRSVTINEVGEIWIEPVGGAPGATQLAATIATVIPDDTVRLSKSEDANIRNLDGDLPPPNQGGKVLQGVLEGSNVNTINELIMQIDNQRSFEFGVQLVTTAKELDEAGARLLRMPEG